MGNIEKFDLMAARYDTPDRVRIAEIIATTIRRYLHEHNKDCANATTSTTRRSTTRGNTSIDYGCGTGLVGLQLLDVLPQMLFVDAAPAMVAEVAAKLRGLPAKQAEQARVLCADFHQGAPAGLAVDYLLLVQVLLHELNPRALLMQLHSVLEEGGHLLIVDFDTAPAVHSAEVQSGFDQQELAALLEELSFSHIHSETFYHGEQLFMGQAVSLFILDAQK